MNSQIVFAVVGAALLSIASFAKVQTMVTGTDEAPVSLTAGINTMGAGYNNKTDKGFGAKQLGGSLGVSFYAGNNFEYGINFSGSYSSNVQYKIFDKKEDTSGFRGTAELAARFMPKISDTFTVGVIAGVGVTRLTGKADKSFHDAYKLGDMFFNVGPAFTHFASESFSWGAGLTYGLSDLRFGGDDKAHVHTKDWSNFHTLRLPIDFAFNVSANLDVTAGLEFGHRFFTSDKSKWYHGVYGELAAGVVYTL